jgi:hypothetical protein
MKNIIFLLISTSLFFGCINKKNLPENFDYGHIENNTYFNEYFKLEMPFEPDWDVQNKEQMEQIAQMGNDYAVGGNDSLKKVFEASQVNVAQLLLIFKHPVGSTMDFNPSMLINAENLRQFQNVRTPKGYISEAKKFLASTAINYEYRRDEYEIELGGKTFMCLEIENLDYNIKQDYFVTLRKGFALAIIVSYDNEVDKGTLYSNLKNIKI